MEINHIKYCSIENHYRKEWIEKVRETLKFFKKEDAKFVVSEKIHGANFQFYVTEDQKTKEKIIKIGKRKSLVTPKDKFFTFGVNKIRKTCDKKVIQLYDLLKKQYPKLTQIILFGELYGGEYPGFEREAKPVQKYLYYCPEFDFYPFDLRIIEEGDDDSRLKHKKKWLTYEEFAPLMEKIDFGLYGKAIFRGTLEECLKFDIRFKTRIPKLKGLKDFEEYQGRKLSQICEGVVIKPESDNFFTANGSRVIIKYKNSDFAEVEPKKKQKKQKKSPKEPKKNDPKVDLIWEDYERYITPQRLGSVLSKLGEVTMKDFKTIMNDVYEDAKEEFEKDFKEWDKDLDDKLKKQLQTLVRKKISFLIKMHFRQPK